MVRCGDHDAMGAIGWWREWWITCHWSRCGGDSSGSVVEGEDCLVEDDVSQGDDLTSHDLVAAVAMMVHWVPDEDTGH